jgi:hypothetical protein
MGWATEMQDLLGQYRNPATSSSAANTSQDYDRLTQAAPSSVLAGALASTIRSPQTPAFGELIAQLFGSSNPLQRAGILQHLQQAAGAPAAAGGAAQGAAQASLAEQANSMRPEAVRTLAEQAERRDPSIVERASAFYAQHPTLVKGLGAALLATLMHHAASQHRPS